MNPAYLLMKKLGIIFVDGKAILYKEVEKVEEKHYCSFWPFAHFFDGKIAETDNHNGFCLSSPICWDTGQVLIACEIREEDLILVENDGTVRVKKFKVIKEIKRPIP